MKTAILGTGSYLPQNTVKNDDYAKYIETNDEWISTRTGIKTRNIAFDESNLDMAVIASERALTDAGIKASELDLIIFATVSQDTNIPSMACQLKKRILAPCPAFDINAACSGFLYGIETADGFLQKQGYNNILVVGSEKISQITNWTDRGTCVLFGDGAGAVVLGKGEQGMLCSLIRAEDDNNDLLVAKGEESFEYTSLGEMFEKTSNKIDRQTINMNGREVFKFATKVIGSTIDELLEMANLSTDDIDLIVPHQANYRIIEYACKKTGIDMDKFFLNLDHTGNMSAASVPVALDEANRLGKIKKGDKVLFVAFGGGLTYSGMIFEWVK